MANLSVRKLNRDIGETSPTGGSVRTEEGYEYGFEVDGVFVRIGVIGAGQVEDARNRHAAEQERNPQPDTAAQPDASSAAGGSGDAPDEQSTVSGSRSSGAKR
jgi:hypothetical protein